MGAEWLRPQDISSRANSVPKHALDSCKIAFETIIRGLRDVKERLNSLELAWTNNGQLGDVTPFGKWQPVRHFLTSAAPPRLGHLDNNVQLRV